MIGASLIIALLAAITLLAGLAARTGIPHPVVLVTGGLVMGLAPGIPSPRLNPDLVLVLFLPPFVGVPVIGRRAAGECRPDLWVRQPLDRRAESPRRGSGAAVAADVRAG